MKSLIATTAIVLALGMGTANATVFDDSNSNTNKNTNSNTNVNVNSTKNLNLNVLNSIQKTNVSQGQAQNQGQEQDQLQSQQQKADTRDNFEFSQKYEAAASSGAISLGQGSFGAAAGECWSTGRGQSWGFGGTGGTVPGTGSGLFNRATTEESVFVNCWASNGATRMRSAGNVKAAEYLECMDPFIRLAMRSVDATACEGVPQIVKAVVRPETESLLDALQW